MKLLKKYRKMIGAIKPYGLTPEVSRKHLKIIKDGKMVTSVSLTPRQTEVAVEHTLRHLMNDGYLPRVSTKSYLYDLKRMQP